MKEILPLCQVSPWHWRFLSHLPWWSSWCQCDHTGVGLDRLVHSLVEHEVAASTLRLYASMKQCYLGFCQRFGLQSLPLSQSTEKSAKCPSTKNTKHLCKSTCYAVTNIELTSSRILSLLSLNSYTSIAGAVTPQMLSKQKNSTLHTQFTSRLLITPPELDRIVCTEDFFEYMEMSIAPRGKRFFIRSLPASILL